MSFIDVFSTEKVALHKMDGTTISNIAALVDADKFHIDDTTVNIEEGDIFERTLPSGAKEYYCVIDRGFYRGDFGIPDHYQTKVQKTSQSSFQYKVDSKEVKRMTEKPHKLLISHSSKDQPFVEALVKLLEAIRIPEESIVCTSVPGYGIPGGKKIYEWLREQFTTWDLRVLFVLSKNYYDSAACLNEMGAAWLARSNATLLLLPHFRFDDIQGCIDKTTVGISFEAPECELKYRLDELKDTLVQEYHLQETLSARWERYRDSFIQEVKGVAVK